MQERNYMAGYTEGGMVWYCWSMEFVVGSGGTRLKGQVGVRVWGFWRFVKGFGFYFVGDGKFLIGFKLGVIRLDFCVCMIVLEDGF